MSLQSLLLEKLEPHKFHLDRLARESGIPYQIWFRLKNGQKGMAFSMLERVLNHFDLRIGTVQPEPIVIACWKCGKPITEPKKEKTSGKPVGTHAKRPATPAQRKGLEFARGRKSDGQLAERKAADHEKADQKNGGGR